MASRVRRKGIAKLNYTRWNKSDDKKLWELSQLELSDVEIAERMERSASAVTSRRWVLREAGRWEDNETSVY